jgi:hypothetical protein
MDTLNLTQLAAIDFLILVRAQVRGQMQLHALAVFHTPFRYANCRKAEGSSETLQKLVTFDASTFSSYLVEHRLLHMGVPRETATCVFRTCETVPAVEVRMSRHVHFAAGMSVGSYDVAQNVTFVPCTCHRPGWWRMASCLTCSRSRREQIQRPA